MTYNQTETKKLLRNKLVVVIGDSIQRGVYKDLVTLLDENRLTKDRELKLKLEASHCGDKVYEESERTNAKTFREVRQYQTNYHVVRFYFVTRVYSDYMETVLLDMSKEPTPDLIIINSCLWDMSRYGPKGDETYKENLQMFFSRAEEMLPKHTLLIWLSGLPVSNHPKAGVLPSNLKFLGASFPIMVRVANFYAAQVVRKYDRDYLDAHYPLNTRKHLRIADGVHWNPVAHRYITNMILKHAADAWDVEKPRTSPLQNDMMIIEQQYKAQQSLYDVGIHQRSLSMPSHAFGFGESVPGRGYGLNSRDDTSYSRGYNNLNYGPPDVASDHSNDSHYGLSTSAPRRGPSPLMWTQPERQVSFQPYPQRRRRCEIEDVRYVVEASSDVPNYDRLTFEELRRAAHEAVQEMENTGYSDTKVQDKVLKIHAEVLKRIGEDRTAESRFLEEVDSMIANALQRLYGDYNGNMLSSQSRYATNYRSSCTSPYDDGGGTSQVADLSCPIPANIFRDADMRAHIPIEQPHVTSGYSADWLPYMQHDYRPKSTHPRLSRFDK